MISVIDYGAGNLRSIERALTLLGEPPTISRDPGVIGASDAIVFPGVGNAKAAMDRLHASGMVEAVRDSVSQGTPIIGLCLGMQLLFGDQEEGPTTGLGLLEGTGVRLPKDRKVPHMGWNTVTFTDHGPFAGSRPASFYFVHSYTVRARHDEDISGTTRYGDEFPSVVARDNIWGTQFHPEKSGDVGIDLLNRWLSYVRTRKTP